jgi:hypothetical protein
MRAASHHRRIIESFTSRCSNPNLPHALQIMSDSLRDQLLALGFARRKPEPAPAAPKPRPQGRREPPQSSRPPQHRSPPAAPREPDLAQAYALRERLEREAREQAQREAAEQVRLKKERKAKLGALLAGNALNDANAEHARHFEHGGKIRRIYVTPEQLAKLNAGELGVVQLAGRYLLVARECALAAAEIAGEALVLLPDPGVDEDGVPADLVW